MVNWDDVADKAEKSPRGLVSGYLEDVDEVDLIVIAAKKKDGSIDVSWSWDSGGERDYGSLVLIGMLETAKAELLGEQRDGLDH